MVFVFIGCFLPGSDLIFDVTLEDLTQVITDITPFFSIFAKLTG
jgi:hypothetical protein